jgi:hypothetical protein
VKLMMTMMNHMRSLGVAFTVVLWTAFAAAPALAQHAASDRSGEGRSVADNTAAKSAAPVNGVDPGNDHGSANRARAGDASHIGVSAHDGFGIEASHAGAAPAIAPGMTAPRADAGADSDLGPIRLEGFTGLQRRANRKALIANVPKISGTPPASIGISAPFRFSGANGGTVHNAASVVVPGASGSALANPSLGRNAPELRTSAATNVNAVGSVATVTGASAAWHRPNPPSSAVAGAPSHAAVISGTTVSHIASGPGYLGGPAKDRSGINGTAIRPRY